MTEHASSSSSSDPLEAPEAAATSLYNQGLTPLHPSQKSLIRIRMIIRSLVLRSRYGFSSEHRPA